MTYYNNYRPNIVSNGGGNKAYLHVNENDRFVTDTATRDNRSTESNGRLSYYIAGGTDSHLFEVDRRSGKVYFKSAPDYEAPKDYGRNNKYQVAVKVVDAAGYSDTQLLDISVKNVQEVDFRPKIVSNGGGDSAHVNVSENTTFVTDVTTVDNLSTEANGRLSYYIHGGADRDFFSIDKQTGKMYFNYAPDYEAPKDSDYDNAYEVQVKVVDGAGYTDTQTLKVKVGDIEEGGHNPDPKPTPTKNVIRGDNGNNVLYGTDADEIIIGEGGNDSLFGEGGYDKLLGTDAISRGVGEVDNLSGGAGSDEFILGDAKGAYYAARGFGDFAIINDFEMGQDKVTLSGGAGDYILKDGTEGNAFILTKNGDDAIAQFIGQSSATMDLNAFNYV